MMKRIVMASFMLLLLSGCFPSLPQEEEQLVEEMNEQEQEQVVEVVPQIITPDNYYQSVLYDGSYLHGESRGFGNSVMYNRLDLDQLEIGLTRIAQQHFDIENYYFREGQFIKRNVLNSWLMRYDEESNPDGLNPALGEEGNLREREESQPRYLSHILEHNYLVEDSNGQLGLGGIVIGLSMNSVYNFRIEDEQGRYNFYELPLTEQNIEQEADRIAKEILTRLRTMEEGAYQDIPILFAVFQEQPRDSVIPGKFIAKAMADPKNDLDRFQRINERYFLFPSNEANQEARNEADQFQRFKDDIQEFFDTYLGVVGKGRYVDNQIQELTIEIPLRFQGKAEIVALSQYVASQLQLRFQGNYKVSVEITSVAGNTESVVVQNPDEEPFIHVFN
ncbi:CamS family sex pheromone protein [Halalkalibacter akibai]|uniref:Putative pheromone cAM373 lipoprotein CamS n=1 Tax=Halalkalibacter akibai (strain ATCC 43226 / DSM 21942 / CIP 109018 / JCM 9157 / 1139) TaxID=1236973 RepID=W4QWI1_HALA3|nr:CamS family sex pheromone protein [Halalkalibacter akibai]GAE36272.1 putative pheromone cAM373 precursor lipoprotein CamS [Halalkalibacter akibai JCM 9157]